MKELGIGTVIHYPIPIHKQQAYQEYNNLSFSNAEEIGNTILSLPMYYQMPEENIAYVIDKLNNFDKAKCLVRKK